MAAAIGPISTSGARPGEHRPAVVLGDPVAVVAERVGQPREVERVGERCGPVEPAEIGDWSRTLSRIRDHDRDARAIPKRGQAPFRYGGCREHKEGLTPFTAAPPVTAFAGRRFGDCPGGRRPEGVRAGAQNPPRMVVLGIDPGTANTGYGVVARRRRAARRARRRDDPDRRGARSAARGWRRSTRASGELLDEHRPEALAVEDLYFGANARSAFAVGQARGVVILAAGQRGLPCSSYTPQQVKARRLRLGPRREGPGPADGAARCSR